MARRRSTPPPPLAQREGIDPARLRLPADPRGDWATVRDHLVARFAGLIGAERLDAMFAEGRFIGTDGPVWPETPYRPGLHIWFHRDFAPEERVPFEIDVVHRDDRIVVVDKPHFLATTPRGRHITETALARLRRDLGLRELQPAHRLDRLTAGLVLFVVRAEDRGAYQTLFRDRLVGKEYEAVARHEPELALPVTVRSRIEKERGVRAAREVPGEPNSESRVELLEHRDGYGRYRLLPATGRTHQLRVHMNSLGVPVLNDPVYPLVREAAPDDPLLPLQLLARQLEFTDPLTGERHRFRSGRHLLWAG